MLVSLRLQSKLQQVQLALKLATGDNNMTISQSCAEYDVFKRDGNTAWNEKLVEQGKRKQHIQYFIVLKPTQLSFRFG